MGIPGAWVGPGDPGLFHKVDEHIEIEDLIKALKIYTLFILRFCG
jgi:acetylornithine deacetylase/succinyl-diaminopimelate desuccinylase-like protein